MSNLDWLVLLGTLSFIVIYGVWKTRGSRNIKDYLLGNNELKWWTIGLSVMATQASAITFLSTPGQAYVDGMRFLQFYLGLPIAMVILCITFIPLYYKLKVYTAYEFLESRFDLKTRTLAATLFLIQRGLAAGITIYAPAIILSTLLDWNLTYTILVIGTLVIVYTVSGGTRAVSVTQKQQMIVIMSGMVIAFLMIVSYIPVSFGEALQVAGKMGKLDAIDFSFDFSDRYNFWSGITGGLFLALSYFGTDQSQVARYISGRSIRESRLGLIFNGLLKVPMQFFILLVGVMVFVFYQFTQPPIFFNQVEKNALYQTEYRQDLEDLEKRYDAVFVEKKGHVNELVTALKADNETRISQTQNKIEASQQKIGDIRQEVKNLIAKSNPEAELNDKDYVFLTFVLNHLPHGLIGLLLAVIFSAAMSSTSSELNALASTTTVDLYKRSLKKDGDEKHYLQASKFWTVFWGLLAILFASYAHLFDNLIQLVNWLGSIFYGTILGIFIAAFYVKSIKANAVFYAALLAQALVLTLNFTSNIGYLWFNVIGSVAVIVFGLILQTFIKTPIKEV